MEEETSSQQERYKTFCSSTYTGCTAYLGGEESFCGGIVKTEVYSNYFVLKCTQVILLHPCGRTMHQEVFGYGRNHPVEAETVAYLCR